MAMSLSGFIIDVIPKNLKCLIALSYPENITNVSAILLELVFCSDLSNVLHLYKLQQSYLKALTSNITARTSISTQCIET